MNNSVQDNRRMFAHSPLHVRFKQELVSWIAVSRWWLTLDYAI
jgi:hypothetical protein